MAFISPYEVDMVIITSLFIAHDCKKIIKMSENLFISLSLYFLKKIRNFDKVTHEVLFVVRYLD